MEENSSPDFVLKLQASDADSGVNAEIEYELLSTADASGADADGAFELHPQTGNVNSLKEFNREASPYYNLTIKAKDKVRTPVYSAPSVLYTFFLIRTRFFLLRLDILKVLAIFSLKLF